MIRARVVKMALAISLVSQSVWVSNGDAQSRRRRRAAEAAAATEVAPEPGPAVSAEPSAAVAEAGPVAGTPEPAAAEAPPPAVEPRQESAARTAARAQYAEGQRLFQSGSYREAENAFREAYASSPSPLILLGIAAAQERRNLPGATRRTLRRYLDENPAAADRAAVESRIAALTPTTGTVAVAGTAGALIFVDGAQQTEVVPATITIEDGDHTVRAEMAGYDSREEIVEVTSNGAATLDLTLTETPTTTEETDASTAAQPGAEELVPEPGAAASSGPSTAVWVATAVTVVGLLTGTILGFAALNEQGAFDLRPSASSADRGESFAMVADLAFAVTVGAGITALVLYFTDRPAAATPAAEEAAPSTARLRLVPGVSPTAGSLSLTGQF